MMKIVENLISDAKNEMKKLKHPYVGTEHLLLALLSDSKVEKVTATYGLTYDKFRDKIIKTVGTGEKVEKECILTPKLRSLLDEMVYSKRDRLVKLDFIRGILCDEKGVACRLLVTMDIDLMGLDEELEQIEERSNLSFISKYKCLIDLNEEVEKNDISVTGFDKELDQLLKNLLRLKKPNTVIIGEPGVGKTALVEKLAEAINKKQVPEFLQNLRIIQLSLGSAVAGTKYRGEFEDKLNNILTEVEKRDNIVLFIDEFHDIVGAGGAEGAIDASSILKPSLARGKIKMIGATTKDEYNKYITKDKALARRFNMITILEATKEETINIMKASKPKLEKHYGIKISNKDIEDIYKESTHKNGRMPDVALDSLEEYCVNKYFNKKKEKVGV